jgi:protein-disulfide isomerase
MAGISASMLSTYCLFCILTYVLSFLTLFVTLRFPKNEDQDGGIFSGAGMRWFLVGLIGLPAFTALGNSVIKANLAQDFDRQVSSLVQGWLTEPNSNVTQATGMNLGADRASAKMLIIEFADFQCIHCKMAAPAVKSFVKSRKDVSLVFVPFPLDGKCNSAIAQSGNGRSCVLAASALCADKQGHGWEVSDWLFENFGKFELSELSTFVESTGVDMERFRACRDADETMESIRANAKIGETAGIKGTPTFFVNGRQLQGAQFIPVLEAAYNKISGN